MSELFKKLEQSRSGDRVELNEVIQSLKFNSDGLIPAIAQDYKSKDVLMMAWMNKQSIEESLRTKQVCYWSRSRQKLWRKGETSGHIQELKSMRIDCDGDTLLLLIKQTGPACHTNRYSCFYLETDAADVKTIFDMDDN